MKRPGMKRVRLSRVVLVGLPGAGKSTVAPLLARSLGFDSVDPDREIERAAGMDIAAIFRERGEATFRALEREAVRRILRRERIVAAPGGGWATQAAALESLPGRTAVVWLKVSPTEAARRLERDEVERPLLSAEDLVERLGELEGERVLAYSAADVVVETDRNTPEAVAAEVAARLHAEYGIDGESD